MGAVISIIFLDLFAEMEIVALTNHSLLYRSGVRLYYNLGIVSFSRNKVLKHCIFLCSTNVVFICA